MSVQIKYSDIKKYVYTSNGKRYYFPVKNFTVDYKTSTPSNKDRQYYYWTSNNVIVNDIYNTITPYTSDFRTTTVSSDKFIKYIADGTRPYASSYDDKVYLNENVIGTRSCVSDDDTLESHILYGRFSNTSSSVYSINEFFDRTDITSLINAYSIIQKDTKDYNKQSTYLSNHCKIGSVETEDPGDLLNEYYRSGIFSNNMIKFNKSFSNYIKSLFKSAQTAEMGPQLIAYDPALDSYINDIGSSDLIDVRFQALVYTPFFGITEPASAVYNKDTSGKFYYSIFDSDDRAYYTPDIMSTYFTKFTVESLATPTITRSGLYTISWNKVEEATNYVIFLNGAFHKVVSGDILSYAFNKSVLSNGLNNVYVVAAKDAQYDNSTSSVKYSYRLSFAKVDRRVFSLNTTADDSQDAPLIYTEYYLYNQSTNSNTIQIYNLNSDVESSYSVNSSGVMTFSLAKSYPGAISYKFNINGQNFTSTTLSTTYTPNSLNGYYAIKAILPGSTEETIVTNTSYSLSPITNPVFSWEYNSTTDVLDLYCDYTASSPQGVEAQSYIVKYYKDNPNDYTEEALADISFYRIYNVNNVYNGDTYYVYLQAVHSNPIFMQGYTTHTVFKVPYLDTPELTARVNIDRSVDVSWTKPSQAHSFHFNINNGTEYTRTTQSVHYNTLANGNYAFNLYCTSLSGLVKSDTVQRLIIIGDLEAPTLTLDKTVADGIMATASLYPDADQNTITYLFSIDNGPFVAQSSNISTYSGLSVGTHTIKVYAAFNETISSYSTSPIVTQTIELSKLPNPSNFSISNNILTWNGTLYNGCSYRVIAIDENEESYELYTGTNTAYNLTNEFAQNYHFGLWNFTVQAIYSNTSYNSSVISGVNTTYTISYVLPEVVDFTYNSFTIEFTDNPIRTYYYYKLSTDTTWKQTTDNIIEFNDMTVGIYTVEVKVGVDTELSGMQFSETKTVLYTISPLDSPSISLSKTRIDQITANVSITGVSLGNYTYYFSIDGLQYTSQTYFSKAFSDLDPGSYTIYTYVSLPSGSNTIDSPVVSSTLRLPILTKPTNISISNDTIYWDTLNENGNEYIVVASNPNYPNELILSMADYHTASYKISDSFPIDNCFGTWTYKVKNTYSNNELYDSQFSDSVNNSYTIPSPVLSEETSTYKSFTVTYDDIENASHYEFKLTTETVWDSTISNKILIDGLLVGTHTLQVRTCIDTGIGSEYSSISTISHTIDKLPTPSLTLTKPDINQIKATVIKNSNYPTNYTIYYKLDDGSFITQSALSKTYTQLMLGTYGADRTYTVTVKVSVPSGSGNIESDEVSSSIVITRLPSPFLNIASNLAGFTWGYPLEYASYVKGFKVFISTDGANYSAITSLSNTTRSYQINTMTANTYYFKLQAYYVSDISIYGTSNYFDSILDLSNVISIIVDDLAVPNILWNTSNGKTLSIASWNPITNADYYSIYINNDLIDNIVTTTYTIDKGSLPVGEYDLKIKAISNSKIHNASESSVIKYNVDKISTPIIAYNSALNLISWSKSTAANYNINSYTVYDIFINNSDIPYTDQPISDQGIIGDTVTWAIPDTDSELFDDFSIKIIAYNIQEDVSYPNPYHMISDYSNILQIGQWKTPVNLRVDNGDLVWDYPDTDNEPSEYIVYNYGEVFMNASNNRISIPKTEISSFNFSVKIEASLNMAASNMSETLSVNVTKLNTPSLVVNTIEEDGQLRYLLDFDPINGADYYKLFVNSIIIDTIDIGHETDTYINLSSGSSDIRIQACSNQPLVISSELSNIVSKYKASNYRYYVWINKLESNNPDIKTGIEREIELPFTIEQSADEALSTGSVNLILNDDKEPYETNTDIAVVISSEGEDSNDNTIDPKYRMLISGDTVTEVFINGETKYRHSLSLVEQTKLLEYDIMPDISYTQKSEITNNSSTISDITINNSKILGVDVIVRDSFPSWQQPNLITKNIFTINNKDPFPSFNAAQPYNEVLELPYLDKTIQLEQVLLKKYFSIFTGQDFIDYKEQSYSIYNYPVVFKYYIRKHTNLYADPSNEYLIATYNPSIKNIPTFNFSDFITEHPEAHFTLTDKYDICIRADKVHIGTRRGPDGEFVEYDVSLMVNKNFTPSKYREPHDYRSDPFILFRINYTNISFTDPSAISSLNEETISIVDAIERAINVIEPLKYNKDYLDYHKSAKYTLDKEFKNNPKYKNIECPQVNYTNGKSIYEVLKDLGREFSGIPYLDYTTESNRTIKFRIMNNNKEATEDNSQILISSSSSMENNVTGFVSNVNNIVTDNNNSIFYPSADGWVTPRSVSNNPVIDTNTCGLILDKPIYKLLKVYVTNYDLNRPTEEADITYYVKEKIMYDALDNDATGKGQTLYYSRGDNKIYGIGQIPETDDVFRAALGLSETDYVITRIILCVRPSATLSRGELLSKDRVKDYKFRIQYVPYTDTQLKLTQFNLSNENNFSYKAYGQDTNLVSDAKFGSSLTKQIDRLGNNDKTRSYITYGMDKIDDLDDSGLTELFDCRVFDNERYYADRVTTTFNDQYINVIVNYSKNFNKINDRIGVNSEYREYEIALNATANRVINMNQYCYIDTKEYKMDNRQNISNVDIHPRWNTILENLLQGYLQGSPNMFYCGFRNTDDTSIKYRKFNDSNDEMSGVIDYGVLAPATRLNIKNAIVFNGKMYDNFSAGQYADTSVSGSIGGKYATKDARYVNTYGKVSRLNIGLFKPKAGEVYEAFSYPKSHLLSSLHNDTKYDTIFYNEYLIDKDSSEALSFNYQMNFNTLNKNIEIQSGMTRYLLPTGNDKEMNYANKPHLIAFKGDISNDEFMQSASIVYDLGAIDPSYTENTSILYMPSISYTGDTSQIQLITGYAVIWPGVINNKLNEILFYVKKKADNDSSTYTTDTIYFNFLDSAILNNNLINSRSNV